MLNPVFLLLIEHHANQHQQTLMDLWCFWKDHSVHHDLKKKLMKVYSFDVRIHYDAFDVSNESHKAIIQFILFDSAVVQLALGLTPYSPTVKLAVKLIPPLFFKLFPNIHRAYSLLLYFQIIEFHWYFIVQLPFFEIPKTLFWSHFSIF